jgi:hypothetical protein
MHVQGTKEFVRSRGSRVITTIGAVIIASLMIASVAEQRETSAEPASSVSNVSQHDQGRFQNEAASHVPNDAPPAFSREELVPSAMYLCTYHRTFKAQAPMD